MFIFKHITIVLMACLSEMYNPQDTVVSDEGKIDTSSRPYGLYMIYSSHELKKIQQLVNSYNPEGTEAIKMMRIDYVKNTEQEKAGYKETNRTVCVLLNKAYEELKSQGYTEKTGYDFIIAPYAIRRSNHPPKGTSYAFFIVTPPTLSNEEVQKQVHQKFDQIVDIKFLNKTDYTISFPTVSREEENCVYRGHAIVTFSNKVDRDIIARIKVILDMTRWYLTTPDGGQNTIFFHVAWLRSSALSSFSNKKVKAPLEPKVKLLKLPAKAKAPTTTNAECANNPFELLNEA